MRLVTFEIATPLGPVRRTGAIDATDHVIDLSLARAAQHARKGRPRYLALAEAEVPSDMLELLQGGEYAMECAREAIAQVGQSGDDALDGAAVRRALADVRLLAPLPRPNSLRDFLVFEAHLRNICRVLGRPDELPPEWYKLPAHYKGNPDAIYGPEDVVPYPGYTDKLDYELEICAVVGKRGRRVKEAEAGAYIAGYTLYNDWSARDIQMRESSVGIGPGIGKDMASSIGPTIATPDEFSREHSRLEARIDGETWSSGTLADMQFSFEQIIEFISQESDIVPGDLLGSGTIGMGCGFERDRYLEPGMTVELEAEGIGLLRNVLGEKGPRSQIGA
ncbi:MAG TPA: fumarylacetoacetate hydrolase family protein [Solirubrobacteraceae bacterium]|nr:fumarylacetoacetate hydrolase family protein [Solirubrobacteraceae bacterium]